MHILADPQTYVALATLTALEIVLGVDNILFISIVVNNLPKAKRNIARKIGLSLALFGRLALLASFSWLLSLTKPLFHIYQDFSAKDVILILGGLFLLYKASTEIFEHIERNKQTHKTVKKHSFVLTILQICIIDIIFSIDSVITAVGLVNNFAIMAVAIVIAVAIMLLFSGIIADFLDKHPSLKVLGLSFLLLIGFLLIADGFKQEMPKGYVYFALVFSSLVEFINIKYNNKVKKLK